MKAILLTLALLAFNASGAWAQTDIRQESVRFNPGRSSATLKGKIKGREIVDYRLHATAGQTMTVSLKSSNRFNYFNVMPPGDETALFVGSTSGNRYTGSLVKTGDYTVRVYLMANAARRNEAANYSIDFKIDGEVPSVSLGHPTKLAATDKPFDKVLTLQGIKFHVMCQNAGSINTLQIVPEGLEIDNSSIKRTIEGSVSGAEVGDLNADASPEVYVYLSSAGSGSYGSLVAFAANKRKSLSEIYLAPVTENKKAAQGYQGHDEFAVVENTFVQRFPIYRKKDINAKPTGGMRQLQYKLKQGEAGWRLALEKMVEY